MIYRCPWCSYTTVFQDQMREHSKLCPFRPDEVLPMAEEQLPLPIEEEDDDETCGIEPIPERPSGAEEADMEDRDNFDGNRGGDFGGGGASSEW